MATPAINSAVQHQAYQAMPNLDVPFLDHNGKVSAPWYFFFTTLWQKAGAGTSTQQLSTYLQNEDSVNIYNSGDGTLVGPVPLSGTLDGDQLVQQSLTQLIPFDNLGNTPIV